MTRPDDFNLARLVAAEHVLAKWWGASADRVTVDDRGEVRRDGHRVGSETQYRCTLLALAILSALGHEVKDRSGLADLEAAAQAGDRSARRTAKMFTPSEFSRIALEFVERRGKGLEGLFDFSGPDAWRTP